MAELYTSALLAWSLPIMSSNIGMGILEVWILVLWISIDEERRSRRDSFGLTLFPAR